MASDANRRMGDAGGKNKRRPQPSRNERLFLPPLSALATCSLVVVILVVSGWLCQGATGDVAVKLRRAAVAFGCASMSNILLCHFIDPGKPRPDPRDEAPADEDDDAQRVRVHQLAVGKTFQQKWCRDCRIWRPHRCGHCHFCGRCVLRLDHHCGFMGTCIGEHNMRFFAAFLFFAGLGISFVVASSLHYMHQLGCWSSIQPWTERFQPVAIIAFLFFCPVPCPCCSVAAGSPLFSLAGIALGGMMLADTEIKDEGGGQRKITDPTAFALGEIKAGLTCRGGRAYCCGPLSLRWVPDASKAVSPPALPSAVEMGIPQSEDETDEQLALL